MLKLLKLLKPHLPLAFYIFLIVCLGLYLPLALQISLYATSGLVWLLYKKTPHPKRPNNPTVPTVLEPHPTVSAVASNKVEKQRRKCLKYLTNPTLWLLIAFLLIFLTRLYPFLSGHPAPLGYDTGIYKFEFEQAIKNLPGFSMAIHPGLFFFSDFLHFFGIDSNFLMREGYLLLTLLVPFMVYTATKEFFGKNAGIFAVIIFALSSLQFDAYTFILYKNTLGLSVLLFSLILINRRSYFLLPIGLFLAVLQPTHFILLGATLFIIWILNWKNKKDRKYFFLNGALIGAGATFIFLANPGLINAAIQIIQKKDPLSNGVFLQMSQGIDFMSFYFPLALIAFIHLFKKQKSKPLLIISSVTAFIVLLRMFFYQRYLIELDLFVIILAGVGLTLIIPKVFSEKRFKIFFFTISTALIVLHLAHVKNYTPFIPKNELEKIQALCLTTEENAVIMPTHTYYSPWVRGFSCRETYAPGLFEHNRWNLEAWEKFWIGGRDVRYKLMKETFASERPVYIFIGERQIQYDFNKTNGFEKLDNYLWKWR